MSGFSLSSARKKLLGDGIWVAIGQFLVAIGTFLGIRLLTEFVPPSVFGTVALLLGLSALGQNMLNSPLLNAAYRFYADVGGEGVRGLRQVLAPPLRWSTVSLSLLLIFGGGLYTVFWKTVHWGAFWALALLLASETFRMMELNLLGAARRQRFAAVWQGVDAWLRPALAILLVLVWSPSATSVLMGYALGCGGLYLAFVFFLPFRLEGLEKEEAPFLSGMKSLSSESAPLEQDVSHLRQDIFKYALPLMPLALVGWISSLGDRYIIGGLLGAAQVGLYSAVYGAIQRPFQILGAIVSQTLLPVFNQSLAEHNPHRERKLFWLWLGLITLFSLLGAGLIALLSQWIAWILLAQTYRSASNLMGLLSLGFAFLNIAHVFEYQLYSYKRTGYILLGQSLAAAGSLAIAVPMILWKGLWGAALACPLYYFLYLLLMMGLHRRAFLLHHRETIEPSSGAVDTDESILQNTTETS